MGGRHVLQVLGDLVVGEWPRRRRRTPGAPAKAPRLKEPTEFRQVVVPVVVAKTSPLQVGKVNDRWVIINVLWEMRPEALERRRP